MSGVAAEAPAGVAEAPDRRRMAPPPVVRALAGPALIVASILFVLQGFITGRTVPSQFEVLGEWTANLCFMGSTLASGHLPAWNPHVMAGIPFAADPIHGWMNLPAMVLFTLLPCGTAMRAFFTLQPILGGLGLYGFLRSERQSRVAATVGGLILGMTIAGTRIFAYPWAAGPLAWTAIVLLLASRFLRARSWPARLLWGAATALAFGQMAAGQLSDGLILGAGALVVFVGARLASDVIAGERSLGQAAAAGGALVALIAPLNLAYLLPRLGYLPETQVSLGYRRLDAITNHLTLGGANAIQPPSLGAAWPLGLGLAPGIYLGAAGLGFAFAGLLVRAKGGEGTRGRRTLAMAFAGLALVCYVLSLPAVARWTGRHLSSSAFVDAYLHQPGRFAVDAYLAIAILGAVGLDAWRASGSRGRRIAAIALAVLVWAVLPLAFGADPLWMVLLIAGAVVSALVLVAARFRPALLALLPVVLAIELCLNGLPWSRAHLQELGARPARADAVRPSGTLAWRHLELGAYLRGGAIAAELERSDDGRYLTVAPDRWGALGYFGDAGPPSWPSLGNQQSMVLGLREAQGYNTIQLRRYWTFVRAVEHDKHIRYAAGYFRRPPPVALDLLQVGWVIGRPGPSPPVAGAVPVVREGSWELFRVPAGPALVSFVPSWTVVASADQALAAVVRPGFDPESNAVLEREPGLPAGASGTPSSSISWRAEGVGLRVHMRTSQAGILLIRNAYERNWRATIDGRPTPVLAADYVVQAVAVPAGAHVVDVVYDDPAIGLGVAGSLGSLAIVIILAGWLGRVRRRDAAAEGEAEDVGGARQPPSAPA